MTGVGWVDAEVNKWNGAGIDGAVCRVAGDVDYLVGAEWKKARFAGVFVLLAARAPAQGLSDMRGTVADTSGGSLPGVTVTITNQASGTFREAISNADGSWYVPGLTPGTYQVSAELSGFKRFVRRDLVVAVGNTTTVPISMELGTLEETITVTGESPIIDVTSKQIGGNLEPAKNVHRRLPQHARRRRARILHGRLRVYDARRKRADYEHRQNRGSIA